MSNNFSEKSIDSISLENMFTSQNTQNKSQKNINLKIETKNTNNIAKYISGDEQLIRNKLIMSKNDLDSDSPSRLKMNSNEINNSDQKGSLALALSPIKKGVRKRNMLVDIMEKSKKNNAPKRSVLFTQEFKLKEENAKNERKDVYGVPINRRNKKKIKVTFSDTVNSINSKNQLAEVIPITSYKKYNYIEVLPREEDTLTNKSTCQCCLIN